MKLVEVVSIEKANEDVQRLMDIKKLMPLRRENLEQAVKVVAEAIQYGFVTIDDKGAITQKLIEPVDSLEEITYKSRVDATTINKAIAALKVDNMPNRITLYMKHYTGQTETTLNKLESTDRNTAESIALFFL